MAAESQSVQNSQFSFLSTVVDEQEREYLLPDEADEDEMEDEGAIPAHLTSGGRLTTMNPYANLRVYSNIQK